MIFGESPSLLGLSLLCKMRGWTSRGHHVMPMGWADGEHEENLWMLSKLLCNRSPLGLFSAISPLPDTQLQELVHFLKSQWLIFDNKWQLTPSLTAGRQLGVAGTGGNQGKLACLTMQLCLHASCCLPCGDPGIYGKCSHFYILTANKKLIQCRPNEIHLLASRAGYAGCQCESSLEFCLLVLINNLLLNK